MSELVAVRYKHWNSLSVYHTLDDDGTVECHFGDRDTEFRRVELADLPDTVSECANCAREDYAEGTHGDAGWASKLRSADDPEEVLRS